MRLVLLCLLNCYKLISLAKNSLLFNQIANIVRLLEVVRYHYFSIM